MSGGEGAREPALPTIVIVDDAAEVRSLVRTRLRLSRKLHVVGEAADGVEAIEMARQHRPELMLLDVSMPVMDGLETLPRVLEASPGTRVVMYSGFQEQGLAQRALELGASVFLEKSSSLDTLADELVAALSAATAPVAPAVEPEEPDEDADAAVLREHLERFREVFDDAAIGMATVTLAGQVVRANAALADLLGRPVAELVGTPYAAFVGTAEGRLAAALQEILDGTSRVVQVEHEVPLGSVRRQVLATLAPVLDSAGRPLYLFLQVQDVTAQRAAEEQLRQSEARFRLIVEAVEDYAIFMLSTDGDVQSWNAGAERINGYAEDEIVGRHFSTFYPPEVVASGHPERELEIALREGHYEEEGVRVRKDGTRFWANVLITAVHDRDGRHVGFAKVTRDNTERREMLEMLEQAAEDQAHFLAVTAHELRTPVGVLAGTAETLREHWTQLDDADRDGLLDGMVSSAARLRRLLTDLLTASRLQASALEMSSEPVDVLRLAEAAVATAQRIHPADEVLVEGEPGLVVDGDPDRLAQVLDNLIGNALRHGRPPVRVTVHRVGDTVEVAVGDSGSGVPEEMRERLFDRFATGRSRGGTGLGLFIVRQLARSHAGDAVYLPPAPGEPGSGRFVVSLPLATPSV
ncbi:PAS domain S-box protein [Nocardioides aquiterrae]|uniref:PAS domain S-box protein n=1 Tax=Nocardioides aquiterrae TaxID=203799 RepID=UPI0031E0B078